MWEGGGEGVILVLQVGGVGHPGVVWCGVVWCSVVSGLEKTNSFPSPQHSNFKTFREKHKFIQYNLLSKAVFSSQMLLSFIIII